MRNIVLIALIGCLSQNMQVKKNKRLSLFLNQSSFFLGLAFILAFFQISLICVWVILYFILKSLLRIILSLELELGGDPFQAFELICPWWSPKFLITFPWFMSRISLILLYISKMACHFAPTYTCYFIIESSLKKLLNLWCARAPNINIFV
jgi:hypothetical protein